ncbi:hypothetical protein P3T37_000579 [Kitasatospora sp. MAA4]|nr:hypothetical protein [Kitasatospora sp. MAA4]
MSRFARLAFTDRIRQPVSGIEKPVPESIRWNHQRAPEANGDIARWSAM